MGENVLIKPDSPYLFSNLTLDLQKKTSYSLRQASPQLTTFPVNKQKIRGFPQYLNKFYNGVKTPQNRTKRKPTVYHRTLRTFNPRYSVPYVLCTLCKAYSIYSAPCEWRSLLTVFPRNHTKGTGIYVLLLPCTQGTLHTSYKPGQLCHNEIHFPQP